MARPTKRAVAKRRAKPKGPWLDYAKAVIAGELATSRLVLAACERFLGELSQFGVERRRGIWFDEAAAERACRFFPTLLCHHKGEWAGKPFELQPWQQFIIANVFGWKLADGRRRVRKAYIEIPRKNGKALADDTPILTTTGWKEHGDLAVGDEVFAPSGCPVSVLAVSDPQPGTYFRVCFADGEELVAHEHHEWETRRTHFTGRPQGSRSPMPLVTTRQIADTLEFPVGDERKDRTHSVEIPRQLELPAAELLIDPYVLGVWLGDGHTDSAYVTLSDPEVVRCVEAIEGPATVVAEASGCAIYRFGASYREGMPAKETLQGRLRALGVLGRKHIPDVYLLASRDQRLALAQGLIDTDGYVSKRGQIEYCSTCPELFHGAVQLFRTLGVKVTWRESPATLRGRVVGTRFRAMFHQPPDGGLFVRSSRRGERLSQGVTSRRLRSASVSIVSAEPVTGVVGRCIEVEGGFYLAGRSLKPTHNSQLAAGVGLMLLAADQEPGAEVYSAATKRDQACITRDEATRMVKSSASLKQHVNVFRHNLHVLATHSKFEPLSADFNTLDGLNPHGVLVDELHAHKNRDLLDVLETAMGARRQPLMFMITTAGYSRSSACWELHEYSRKVLEGNVDDDSFFAYVAGTDQGDDWTKPATWAKANPNLGVSVRADYLKREAEQARQIPSKQNAFRRLHLNDWTEQRDRWIDLEVWDACGLPVDPAELAGRRCFVGVDLSSSRDVTAAVAYFPSDDEEEPGAVLGWFWVPEENIQVRVRDDGVPFDAWADAQLVTATPGNVIDYAWIRRQVNELREEFEFDVVEVAYDPWGAVQLATELQDDGFVVVPMRQGFATLSPAMKELEKLILSRRLAHGGNPVLRWMVGNVATKQDPAGNIKPDKAGSSDRIDGVVALAMAVGRATLQRGSSASDPDELLMVL